MAEKYFMEKSVFKLHLLPRICTGSCMNTTQWVGQEREQLAEVELLKPILLLHRSALGAKQSKCAILSTLLKPSPVAVPIERNYTNKARISSLLFTDGAKFWLIVSLFWLICLLIRL